jgi:predicted metal-dependent phosphoesterase TrpH
MKKGYAHYSRGAKMRNGKRLTVELVIYSLYKLTQRAKSRYARREQVIFTGYILKRCEELEKLMHEFAEKDEKRYWAAYYRYFPNMKPKAGNDL